MKHGFAQRCARPSALSFSFGVARIRFSGAVRRAPRVWGAGFAAFLVILQRARIVTESPFGTATEKTLPRGPISTKI